MRARHGLPLALLFAGCSVAAPPPGRAQEQIIGGSADTGDPSVVSLLAADGAAGVSFSCTGSVIGPRVILTAAHCIPGVIPEEITSKDPVAGGGKGPSGDPGTGKSGGTDTKVGATGAAAPAFIVQTGNGSNAKAEQPTGIGVVLEAHAHPLFHGDFGGGHDVAVLIMRDPLDLAVLPLRRSAITDAEIGKPLRVVGYGLTEDGTGGLKRQTTMSLDRVDGRVFTHVDATHGTCNGDSGGPVFLTRDGVEEIAGVTSFGDTGCEQYSSSARVDTELDFLDEQLATFAGPSAAGCTVASRAPSSAGAWLLVIAAIAVLRRRGRHGVGSP